MAFEAAADDNPVEAGVPGGETRAVGPGIHTCEPGQRKLKQLIALPPGIGLRFFRRAKGDVESFGLLSLVVCKLGLEEPGFVFFDVDITGVGKIKPVLCGADALFKIIVIDDGGGPVVVGMGVGIGDVPVAADTGF